jgi:hypothetical protein
MNLELYNDPSSRVVVTDDASGPEHVPIRRITFPKGVKIALEQHDSTHATELRITSTGYIWANTHDGVVLEHSIKHSLRGVIPWKQASHASQRTVDFAKDEMPSSDIRCSSRCHREHKNTIPSYDSEEYRTFQSVIRGKTFLGEHAAASINTHGGSIKTQGVKLQCIKFWKSSPDTSKITITIPLTITVEGKFVIQHVEISPQWMEWDREDIWHKLTQTRPGVRGSFRKSSQSSPIISPQTNGSRKLSYPFRMRRPSSLSSESSSATSDPHDLADPKIAQKWKYIDIEFNTKTGKHIQDCSRSNLISIS